MQSKLPAEKNLWTKTGRLQTIPKHSRLLRISAFQPDHHGGCEGGQPGKRAKLSEGEAVVTEGGDIDLAQFLYEVFGLRWDWKNFVDRACSSQRPFLQDAGVPHEWSEAIDFHTQYNNEQVCRYKLDRCKPWLVRSKELERDEASNRSKRPGHVAEMTACKRILLTHEILLDIGYKDMECLGLLERGWTLAGEIENCDIFKAQYKPCLTLDQSKKDSKRRNDYILKLTVLDKQLDETREELSKGGAEGPFSLDDLEDGATISRRCPLVQGSKTRMIDDFRISGVTDSCSTFNEIDLHVVDTFASVVRQFFEKIGKSGVCGLLEGKTYDLKSAYRQIPIMQEHLKFAYFSVYNREIGKAKFTV